RNTRFNGFLPKSRISKSRAEKFTPPLSLHAATRVAVSRSQTLAQTALFPQNHPSPDGDDDDEDGLVDEDLAGRDCDVARGDCVSTVARATHGSRARRRTVPVLH